MVNRERTDKSIELNWNTCQLAVTLQMWVRILFFCVQANDPCPQFQAFEAMPRLRPQGGSHAHTWMV